MKGRRNTPASHTCSVCGSTKDWWASRTPYGMCADCRNKRKAANRDAVYHQQYYFTRTYGITVQERDEMVASQGGCCAICQQPSDRLHVDHDHGSGRVRSMLCGTCNRGLGMFSDDPALLAAAARYLEASACLV